MSVMSVRQEVTTRDLLVCASITTAKQRGVIVVRRSETIVKICLRSGNLYVWDTEDSFAGLFWFFNFLNNLCCEWYVNFFNRKIMFGKFVCFFKYIVDSFVYFFTHAMKISLY